MIPRECPLDTCRASWEKKRPPSFMKMEVGFPNTIWVTCLLITPKIIGACLYGLERRAEGEKKVRDKRKNPTRWKKKRKGRGRRDGSEEEKKACRMNEICLLKWMI